jgi:hypothetical protein
MQVTFRMGDDAMNDAFVLFCFVLLCLAYSIWWRWQSTKIRIWKIQRCFFFDDEHSVVRSGEVEDKTSS